MPVAITVCILMLLGSLGIILLFETESLLFARSRYHQAKRAEVESGFTLYKSHPDILPAMQHVDTFLDLYKTGLSEIGISRKPWGLYEIVSVTSSDENIHQTRMLGIKRAEDDNTNLYYTESRGLLTLAGKTDIEGNLVISPNGIIYGQIQREHFSGSKIKNENIKPETAVLPAISPTADLHIRYYLQELQYTSEGRETASEIHNEFYDTEPIYVNFRADEIRKCRLSGNIILSADKLRIDKTCELDDIIITGNCITVGSGFCGTLQIFARDSVVIEEKSVLHYPSGIYSGKYAELHDGTEVNGYVVVSTSDISNHMKANYRQSKYARVRGCLYVDGISHMQGIVSGQAYFKNLTYYSREGYYRDALFNATILYNNLMAMPLLFANDNTARTDIKWLK